MVSSNTTFENQENVSAAKGSEDESSNGTRRERELAVSRGRSVDREFHAEPMEQSWKIVTAGTIVPLGLAVAATATSSASKNPRAGVAAWIAVAIAGTASVVATAIASLQRHRHVTRENDRDRNRERSMTRGERD